MEVPDVSYAWSGDVAIAYQVVGEGPPDLVLLPFLSNITRCGRPGGSPSSPGDSRPAAA